MLPIRTGGTLLAVEGRERALQVPGVVAVEVTIGAGRPLVPLPEGNRYLGFVFAHGDSTDQVEVALRAAQGELRVRVQTEVPLIPQAAERGSLGR